MKFTGVLRQAETVLVRAASGYPTGITGLYQHPEPKKALSAIYTHTLSILDKFPQHSVYAQAMLSQTKQRLQLITPEATREKIERDIGSGLIEELIIQANDELNLANELLSLKAWDELEEQPLEDQWTYFGKKI